MEAIFYSFLDFTGKAREEASPRRAKLDSHADNLPEPRRKWDEREDAVSGPANGRKPGGKELHRRLDVLSVVPGQWFIGRRGRILLTPLNVLTEETLQPRQSSTDQRAPLVSGSPSETRSESTFARVEERLKSIRRCWLGAALTSPAGGGVSSGVLPPFTWILPPGTSPERTQLHRNSRQDSICLRSSAGLGHLAVISRCDICLQRARKTLRVSVGAGSRRAPASAT